MTVSHRSPCPIARVLDLVGDRWTLLIIRDLMFFGKHRFEEFLESPEGISTNILTSRLKSLEGMGLVEKYPYSSHSRRMHYQLTERGESLRPILESLVKWGLEQIPGSQIPLRHLRRGDRRSREQMTSTEQPPRPESGED
jgi:DNA-binding HxlR family transcriptional regulator